MTWEISLNPEIFRGFNEANTKVVLPEAVDGYSGCQWVLWINKPFSQGKTIYLNSPGQRGKAAGDSWGNFPTALVVLASLQDKGISSLGVLHHHGVRGAVDQLLAIFLQFLSLFAIRLAELLRYFPEALLVRTSGGLE